MSHNNKWSEDYPNNLVIPPEDSCEVNDTLYRFVRHSEPNQSDFLPSFKDPKQKHLIKRSKFRNDPEYYGTSFFETESRLRQIAKGSPEKFSDSLVARGEIRPFHGRGKYRGEKSEHVSMWFYEGIYPQGFKVI